MTYIILATLVLICKCLLISSAIKQCDSSTTSFPVSVVHHKGFNVSGDFHFDISMGLSLPNVVDDWCEKHIHFSLNKLDRLKIKNHIMKNMISFLTEKNCEASELNMMATVVSTDDQGKITQIKFTFDATKEKFFEKISVLFETISIGNLSEETIEHARSVMLLEVWNYIESGFKLRHFDVSLIAAKDMILKRNPLIVIENPQGIPTGIENIMLAFISCYSFHSNTVIKNWPGFVMGNYSDILKEKHIFDFASHNIDNFRIEPFFTSDLLVLREEETLFDRDSLGPAMTMLNFPNLVPLFSNISLGAVYNRSLFPDSFVKRILRAIRSIEFKSEIVQAAEDISDSFVTPVLGISMRSLNAIHVNGYSMDMNFYVNLYKTAISEIVKDHKIRSIICAFDNDELKSHLHGFLSTLGDDIRVIYFEYNVGITPLQKAAIEMLALSTTTYLLGDKRSPFLQLTYWFGKCLPIVNLIPDSDVVNRHSVYDNILADCEFPNVFVNSYCDENGWAINLPSCRLARKLTYDSCRNRFGTVPYLSIPQFAVGTGGRHFKEFEGNIVDREIDEPAITQIVNSLELGVRHIDTSERYGNDKELSIALQRFYASSGYQREDLWITSKVYNNIGDPITSCREIIRRIGCEYLDLFLLHVPLRFVHHQQQNMSVSFNVNRSLSEIWEDMQYLVSIGLVRHIGVSNFGISDIAELLSSKTLTIVPFLNQVEYNLYLQQRDLRNYCQQQGILLASFGVLLPLKRYSRGPADDLISKLVYQYSESAGVHIPASAVLIRHAQQNNYVTILSAGPANRMKEYVPVIAGAKGSVLLNLSIEDVLALDEIGKFRHQRHYNVQSFPEERATIQVVSDNSTFYFGPRPDYVKSELQKLCQVANLSVEFCLEIAEFYTRERSQEDIPLDNYFVEDPSLHSLLAEDGFIIVPKVLSSKQCQEMRKTISNYVEMKGPLLRKYDVTVNQGHYIADIKTDPLLRYIFQSVHASKTLHSALGNVFFGGEKYRFLQRNELNIDREVGWHRDRVEKFYYIHQPPLDEWSSISSSSTDFLIVNVGIYLEDHDKDGQGLTVEIGSNKCRDCRGPVVALTPKMGDAIIFDNRLFHRGVYKDFLLNSTKSRYLISIGYGRNNVFSDEFENAIMNRNEIFNNISHCAGLHAYSPCTQEFMRRRYRDRSIHF
jgi:diketogulonate reductase-like aldo/keto reductase